MSNAFAQARRHKDSSTGKEFKEFGSWQVGLLAEGDSIGFERRIIVRIALEAIFWVAEQDNLSKVSWSEEFSDESKVRLTAFPQEEYLGVSAHALIVSRIGEVVQGENPLASGLRGFGVLSPREGYHGQAPKRHLSPKPF